MDKRYICYCGLYCENCAVKVKVEPLAQALHTEMQKAGFEEIVQSIPGGSDFWPFLKSMATVGICVSCSFGGGNPDCAVRACAQNKGVEICALCDSYPCEQFSTYFEGYPLLQHDNDLLREQGMEAWAQLQDERHSKGFTYSDEEQTYPQQ